MSIAIASAAPPARPFPQHAACAPGTILPSRPRAQLEAAAASAYDAWKARYFHAGCTAGQAYIAYNLEGRAEPKDAISSSEGHGYGMLLTAFMAGHDPQAQASFDALYAWFFAHPSGLTPGLMSWQQMTGCRDVKGDNDSASDGDFDIAYALLLADRQWGSDGPISYRKAALKLIGAIKTGEINAPGATVKLGDWVTDAPQLDDIRVSDFMPDHLRAFRRATGDPLWDRVLERGYQNIAALQKRTSTGLLPDFARDAAKGNAVPAPKKLIETKHDGDYFYNACRAPWRIGIDALLTGDPRALTALARLNAFIVNASGSDPGEIKAGYILGTGKPVDRDDTSLAFTAPFAVSAMTEPARRQWLDRLCEQLLQPPGEDDDYYGRTICVLSLVALSGNWWSP